MVFEKLNTPYFACVKEGEDIQWPLFLTIRELSCDERASFRSHSATLIENYRDCQLFLAALMNYQAYIALADQYSDQCAENAGLAPSRIGGEFMILNLNRHIMNLLTAVRTFLDHTERNLTHRHGKDSQQFQAFKKATAEAYDSSFAYRFLYKLRNYVQHCGMPIGKISINTRLGEETPPSMSQSLEVAFSRDGLLSNFDSWGTQIKSELASLPAYFPIRPYITEMMTQVEKLQLSQILARCPKLIESFQYLDRLLLEASGRGGMPCICIKTPVPDEEEDYNISMEHFPLELMEMLRKPFQSLFGGGT